MSNQIQPPQTGKRANRRRLRTSQDSLGTERKERVNGRTYLMLECLSPAPRERWLVASTHAGRKLGVMAILPNGKATAQHLHVIRNIQANSVPRVLDLERGAQCTRVVIPWVKGITVKDYLERVTTGKIPPPEPHQAIRLIHELARGLRSFHKYAQIIHGDIKPANLIMTRKSSHLHLIDFGSAWPIGMTGVKLEGDGLTKVFAAPEIRNGGAVDERADQFSASLVLYQLLTGKVPYDQLGGNAGWPELFDKDNIAKPPSDRPLSNKYLPRKLWHQIDAVVLKGLSLNPGHRYEHSSQWCDALERLHLQLRVYANPNPLDESNWNRFSAWLGSHIAHSSKPGGQP